MKQGSTVFVVDDDPSVRRALHRLLRADGLHVETFASGADFLLAVEVTPCNCAVIDIRMPQLSGFEVLESLAARGSNIPVILVTGHANVPMASRTIRTRCVSFLSKPFDEEALLEAVYKALGRRPQ